MTRAFKLSACGRQRGVVTSMTAFVQAPVSGRGSEKMPLARKNTLRDLIWRKGAEVPSLDPSEWRVDHECRLMRHADLDDWRSEYGWTIADVDMTKLDVPGGRGATAAPVAFATLSRRFKS